MKKTKNFGGSSETNSPIFLGGLGKRNFGKQFRQGNRVYSSKGIAVCLTAQPLGNMGGYSSLYVVRK
jgi:DNA (cytosine-5)-methyltransferase 1